MYSQSQCTTTYITKTLIVPLLYDHMILHMLFGTPSFIQSHSRRQTPQQLTDQ